WAGRGIVEVAYWIAISNILNVLVYMFFVAKMVSLQALVPKVSKSVVNRVRKYSTQMAWISLLAVVYKQFDKLLISLMLPIGVLGIYSFAYTTVTKLTLITDAISQAVFPVFSELGNQQERAKALDRFFSLQDMLIYGLIPLFALMVFATLPVFSFLMDPNKARELLLPVLFLCIAFYLNGTLRLLTTYISASGKPGYVIRAIVILLIVVAPITILLIKEFGMVGAAFSWVVTSFINACYIVPAIYINELGKSPGVWLRPMLKVVLLLCGTYVPVWWIVHQVIPNHSLYLALSYLVASGLYFPLALNVSVGGFRNACLRHIPKTRHLIVLHRRE
ncbi:MAG TPA: oligosaccharide flippase family protein, partial [Daejeonella sp.]|nr:oligosaccharide flippase family protein [Daejeonella sp.]